MMRTRLLPILASAVLFAGAPNAKSQSAYFQTLACIKVAPGKTAEYRQFVNETTQVMMQARADAGEIVSWSLLRNVIPAGTEARCDYSLVTTYQGAPPQPQSTEALAKALAKAGVKMTAAQFLARRQALSQLVAYEMWQSVVRVGHPQKGNYLYLNHMKVLNETAYYRFESDIWRPMAEEWVKQGAQSGWQFSILLFPGGSEVKYAAVSADIYPTWEAAFRDRPVEETFKKVHSGKDYQTTMTGINSRDLAVRELMFIEERVAKE
jgi:hypothetical protein